MNEKINAKANISLIADIGKKVNETFKSITSIMPSLEMPVIKIPDLKNIKSPMVIQEQNNWERHAELVNIQDSILKVQAEILKEQKSTSKMTLVILILAILTLIATILTIILK